jgi:nucleoside-diphosphate-sugar epimerase
MKTILVSGASGFLGKALIKRLLESGFKVIGMSRSYCRLKHKNFRFVKVDISDYSQLLSAVKNINKIDCFIHLAAKIYYGDDPDSREEMIATNIVGSYNATRLVNEKKIKLFVYASTMSVYMAEGVATELTTPNPDSLYGWTKLVPEFFVKEIGNWCSVYILRFSGIYGPGRDAGIIYKIVNTYANNKVFDLGSDGMGKWNPLYIDDAVSSVMFFMNKNTKKTPGIYNIGLDAQISVVDIDRSLNKITGKSLVKFSNKKSNLNFFMNVDKIKRLGFKFENIEVSLSKFYHALRGEKP